MATFTGGKTPQPTPDPIRSSSSGSPLGPTKTPKKKTVKTVKKVTVPWVRGHAAQADVDWLAAFSRLNHALGRLPAVSPRTSTP